MNTKDDVHTLLSAKPRRLGHATFLDEEAQKIILEHKIGIEMCLTSNLLCKTVKTLEDHHINFWLNHDVPIAICVCPTSKNFRLC
jgi:adenosine deaminase